MKGLSLKSIIWSCIGGTTLIFLFLLPVTTMLRITDFFKSLLLIPTGLLIMAFDSSPSLSLCYDTERNSKEKNFNKENVHIYLSLNNLFPDFYRVGNNAFQVYKL